MKFTDLNFVIQNCVSVHSGVRLLDVDCLKLDCLVLVCFSVIILWWQIKHGRLYVLF